MTGYSWSIPSDLPPRTELIEVASRQVLATIVIRADGKWHWHCTEDARFNGLSLTVTEAKVAVMRRLSAAREYA